LGIPVGGFNSPATYGEFAFQNTFNAAQSAELNDQPNAFASSQKKNRDDYDVFISWIFISDYPFHSSHDWRLENASTHSGIDRVDDF
jgi:hypothetical protein